MYQLKYSTKIVNDIKNIKIAKLDKKVKMLLDIIKNNPYQNPSPYEKVVGDLKGFYYRRINLQHRLVYQVFENEKIIRVLSVWSHYEF